MTAIAGVPDLSQVLSWPTDHLTEAADHWENVGARTYAVAHQVWRDALTVDWQGEGADALRMATHADMRATSDVADQLQAAAKVARAGVSDLQAARSRLRSAVLDANAAGFDVEEEMSVIDSSTGGSAAQRAAREAHARALAADIRQRAAQLLALDQQVAGRVTAAVAGIRDAFPQHPPFRSSPKDIRAHTVDNHTFKQDPPPQPWQPPPPPYPQGPPVGPGLPPEGLRPPVDGPLTTGPASRPTIASKGGQSLWDKDGGEWRYDPGQDSRHYPHWDYNPHAQKFDQWRNVGINDLPTHKEGVPSPRSGTVGPPPAAPADARGPHPQRAAAARGVGVGRREATTVCAPSAVGEGLAARSPEVLATSCVSHYGVSPE
ncbi:hypothetical protein, partial [Mycobacterium sp. Marseille-P9652]|uniref:hypothetical protein n=1 Tax=Mycobacterium sp. Marseille-P9652 TaxID=2654950 RepID=UPI001E38A447